MLGSIRGALEEGRGRTAEGFRDLDDLRAMCCFRWPCTGIVAAVFREASRLQIHWDSRFRARRFEYGRELVEHPDFPG